MEEAVYIASLARAFPGLFAGAVDAHGQPLTPYDYIREELPQAQGNALLHAADILQGQVRIWPNPKLSRRGRWFLNLRKLWRSE